MPEPVYKGITPGQEPTPTKHLVISPPRGKILDTTILSHEILGIPTHWLFDPVMKKERSHLCERIAGECVYCGTSPLQGLFFLAAWDHGPQCRYILRLGDEGAKAFDRCARRAGKVRGLRCEISDVLGRYGREITCVQSRPEPLTPLPNPHPLDRIVAALLKLPALPGWLTLAQTAEVREGAKP